MVHDSYAAVPKHPLARVAVGPRPSSISQSPGPAGPSSETPLSRWADYTLRSPLPSGNGRMGTTHTRLVVEPSPGPWARELGCGLSIVHPLDFTIPTVQMWPSSMFPPGLGTKGFRSSPQFGCVALSWQADELSYTREPTSHDKTRPA